jgi:hypothetical protein
MLDEMFSLRSLPFVVAVSMALAFILIVAMPMALSLRKGRGST